MAEQKFKRLLSSGFSIAVCVGFIIGVGIMRMPGEIAATITNPVVYILLWIVGSIFTLIAAGVVAELIAATPKSGGPYVLIAHSWGRYPGFFIGWVNVAAGTASAALKTVVLMEFISMVVPSVSKLMLPGALLVTTGFAAFQLGGVRLGANLHKTMVAIVGFLMMLLIAALFLGSFRGVSPGLEAVLSPDGEGAGFAGLGLVISAIIFTFAGWDAPSFFGGEIKGSGRATALGVLRGTLIVSGLYLLLNFALVTSVPLASLRGKELAVSEATRILYGTETPIILLAIFILLIHQNMNYMLVSRTLYALSVDGLGTKKAASISNKGTPTGGVVGTWCLIVVLILSGGFKFLLSIASMFLMVMSVMEVLGVFRLRQKEPDIERPYRAWGFPITGYASLLGYLILMLTVGIAEPFSALYVIAILLISIPVYLLMDRKKKSI
ncbi:MAG: APC family permease [Acidobacteriota bacterium]